MDILKANLRVLVSFVVALLCFAYADGNEPLEDFKSAGGFSQENTSLLIRDLHSGRDLIRYHNDKPLIPASIMKCVTVASLMERAEIDSRFETKVYIEGLVTDSTLRGNLLIVGSGDPSLNSRYIHDSQDICEEIARSLKKRGIKVISGCVRVDESIWQGASTPPSWHPSDLAHDYGAGSFGLNFEDNAIGSRSVSNPAMMFRNRLRGQLAANGIILQNVESDGLERVASPKKLLLIHRSAPLDEIMRSCMMRSDNQYAEALLRTLAVKCGKEGSTEVAAQIEKEMWQNRGFPMEGINIVDGSGLSRSDRMTADFIAEILTVKARNDYYNSLFPLAGEEGTLRKFLKGTSLEGYLAMKTGSMRGIQCYAGYKLDENYHPTHLVVAMFNEMEDRQAARDALGKLLLNLFGKEIEN